MTKTIIVCRRFISFIFVVYLSLMYAFLLHSANRFVYHALHFRFEWNWLQFKYEMVTRVHDCWVLSDISKWQIKTYKFNIGWRFLFCFPFFGIRMNEIRFRSYEMRSRVHFMVYSAASTNVYFIIRRCGSLSLFSFLWLLLLGDGHSRILRTPHQ